MVNISAGTCPSLSAFPEFDALQHDTVQYCVTKMPAVELAGFVVE
jgi:hypothetical protein